ncbi:MAG: guanylate kinase [Dehalococcoidia bacterium]|jgi:guanylate kinase
MTTPGRKRVPLVIVISGPSGVGKDVVIDSIIGKNPHFHHVVTATTRKKRPGEIDGVDYYFLSKAEFIRKIKAQEFLEYAEVYGNYYGVLNSQVKSALQDGKDVILKVDVQGAATLKKKIPQALFIFLAPSSIDDLVERMKRRNADSDEDMKIRMNKARHEMEKRELFDHSVVNLRDNLDQTVKTVREHISEYRRKNPIIRIS